MQQTLNRLVLVSVLLLMCGSAVLSNGREGVVNAVLVPSVRFDFDGDRKAEVVVFRPANGMWYVAKSGGGYDYVRFGLGNDKPVSADFDGDGKYDIAVYRDGVWYILNSSDGSFRVASFGLPTDVPVPAQIDSDGKADLVVFRPSDGTWHVYLSANQSYSSFRFGLNGDIPITSDFDGDGKSDVGVYRSTDATWYWINSSTGAVATARFGLAEDVPLQGDFDGDLKDDIAVWRPSNGIWYIRRSIDGLLVTAAFGLAADIPVPADYDGDGKADIAVFRPSDGVWHRLDSSTGAYRAAQFGYGSDLPIAARLQRLQSPAPTPSPTATPIPSPSPSPTATPTPTPTPTVTPTPTPSPVPTANCTWFVSTSGSRTNAGTQASPWNLVHALSGAGGLIRPGNTVCIMGGTYPGRFAPNLNGTASQPIVVRSYPGQRVILDGGMPVAAIASATSSAAPYASANINVSSTVNLQIGSTIRVGTENMRVDSINYSTGIANVVRGWGGSCASTGVCPSWPSGSTVTGYFSIFDVYGSYTWYWGLEITNTAHITRVAALGEVDKGAGLFDSCTAGCRFINNVIHNTAGGIGSFGNPSGSEYYGNLTFLNGWDGTGGPGDPGRGHGMYIQNPSPTSPIKKITDNLSFFNFGYNMQAYTDQGGIHNLEFTGNAFFESSNPILLGPTFNMLIGGGNQAFVGAKFVSNFTYNPSGRGTDIVGWGNSFCTSPVIQGNYFASGAFELSANCTNPSVTGNTFYTSFSRQSTFPGNTFYSTRPTTTKVFVRANSYEAGRGNIVVYNWTRASSVSVDSSSLGLAVGQRFQIRDAQNFNGGAVYSGTYSGSPITIPMTNTATAPVFGTVNKQPTHSDQQFGAFVCLPY